MIDLLRCALTGHEYEVTDRYHKIGEHTVRDDGGNATAQYDLYNVDYECVRCRSRDQRIVGEERLRDLGVLDEPRQPTLNDYLD